MRLTANVEGFSASPIGNFFFNILCSQVVRKSNFTTQITYHIKDYKS